MLLINFTVYAKERGSVVHSAVVEEAKKLRLVIDS